MYGALHTLFFLFSILEIWNYMCYLFRCRLPADALNNHLTMKFQGVVNTIMEEQQIC